MLGAVSWHAISLPQENISLDLSGLWVCCFDGVITSTPGVEPGMWVQGGGVVIASGAGKDLIGGLLYYLEDWAQPPASQHRVLMACQGTLSA